MSLERRQPWLNHQGDRLVEVADLAVVDLAVVDLAVVVLAVVVSAHPSWKC